MLDWQVVQHVASGVGATQDLDLGDPSDLQISQSRFRVR